MVLAHGEAWWVQDMQNIAGRAISEHCDEKIVADLYIGVFVSLSQAYCS